MTQQYSNASIVVRIATRAPPLEHPNTDAFLTMVEITAQKACAITQVVSMLFGIGASPRASVRHISFARHFRIRFFRAFSYAPPPPSLRKGMLFFPEKMMETYKGAPFTGDGKTMFLYVFGMMGTLMAHGAMINATMRLDSANATARGATCLGNAIGWGIFLFIDAVMAFGLPVPGVTNALPSSMPADGIKANLVLFAAIVGVNVLGWKDAGSPKPSVALPTGVMALPLKILLADALFWGAGTVLAPEKMFDMYLPGVIAKSGSAKAMTWVMIERMGFSVITTIISTLLITSAVPGDADTNYRIARSFVYRNFMFLGFVSRDNVIRAATGWSMPLATQNNLQMLGITLFCATQLGATNITVRKTKSA